MTNEMTAEDAIKILRFEQEQVEHRLDGCSDTQENRNIYEAFRIAIQVLETQFSDAVSRKAVIETINTMRERCDTNDINDYHDLLVESFKVLPSVNPKKVGKWIEVEDNPDEYHYECSECGQRMNWLDEYDHYCCNCGSKNWEG